MPPSRIATFARAGHARRVPRRVVVALLAGLAMVRAAAGGWLLSGVDDVAEPRPELAAALHAAADAVRGAHGLSPTAWDEGLARAARQHAAELAARRVLDHASPTPGRHTVADRLARGGSPYAHHGENLARVPAGLDTVRATIDGWLGSPPHRANLLASAFDRVGFGTALDADGATYVVQVLAAAPWAPVLAEAEVATSVTVRVALGIRAERATGAWLEVAGTGSAIALEAGFQRLVADVALPGPWTVRIGLPAGTPGRFLLDEAGAVATSGRWRADDAPRGTLRVTASEAERVTREVVRLRLRSPVDAELLVGGVHRPDANRGAGTVELDLELADGDAIDLALAERAGGDRLRVVHGFALRRTGREVVWEARP